MMAILGWLGKNLGLMVGLLEIAVQAIGDIIVQIVKVIMGIVNILQPSRKKDFLVNLAAKLEGFHTWLDGIFTKVKGWLYMIAPQ